MKHLLGSVGEFVAGEAVNESVDADGGVLGCEFSGGSTVSRGISWGRLVLGLFLALASVEKVHCRPEAGTEGAAKSLVCTYITLSSGFSLFLLELLESVFPERDKASVEGSRDKSLFHAQVDGVRCRIHKGTLYASRAHWRTTREKVETW